MLELSVQRPTVHVQRYFYKKKHTVQSWIDDYIPIAFAARQKSITEPYPPTRIQLASLFPMGCLGGDKIRFNFGVTIKYLLNNIRHHLASILLIRHEKWSLISWYLVFFKGGFCLGQSRIAKDFRLSSGDPICGTITSN